MIYIHDLSLYKRRLCSGKIIVSFRDNAAGLGEVELGLRTPDPTMFFSLEEPSQWISRLFSELGFLILRSLEEKKKEFKKGVKKKKIPYTLTIQNQSTKRSLFYTFWLYVWFPCLHSLSHSPPKIPSWRNRQKIQLIGVEYHSKAVLLGS